MYVFDMHMRSQYQQTNEDDDDDNDDMFMLESRTRCAPQRAIARSTRTQSHECALYQRIRNMCIIAIRVDRESVNVVTIHAHDSMNRITHTHTHTLPPHPFWFEVMSGLRLPRRPRDYCLVLSGNPDELVWNDTSPKCQHVSNSETTAFSEAVLSMSCVCVVLGEFWRVWCP